LYTSLSPCSTKNTRAHKDAEKIVKGGDSHQLFSLLSRVKAPFMVGGNCISLYISLLPTDSEAKNMAPVLHEPQLDTILMVENAIKKAETYPTRKELWNSLPKKVQYQTFKRILEYLESSNKIVFNGRRIVWVFPDNPKLTKLLESSLKPLR